MGKRDEQEYCSLMNVTNGNILSARLNPIPWGASRKEVHVRPRNFKISQFQTGPDILNYFVNSESIESRWSMGVHEIWVKPEDVDELYTVLAATCLNNFCPSWKKQSALFGAFLFHKDPDLFMSLDFTSTVMAADRILKAEKLGKDFLFFLEEFNILSFIKSHYGSDAQKRTFFSTSEIEVVKRQRKDIVIKFEHVNEEKRKASAALKNPILVVPPASVPNLSQIQNAISNTASVPNLSQIQNAIAQTAMNLMAALQALSPDKEDE